MRWIVSNDTSLPLYQRFEILKQEKHFWQVVSRLLALALIIWH